MQTTDAFDPAQRADAIVAELATATHGSPDEQASCPDCRDLRAELARCHALAEQAAHGEDVCTYCGARVGRVYAGAWAACCDGCVAEQEREQRDAARGR